MEPHGLKPMAPLHASKGRLRSAYAIGFGRTLRTIPHYAPNEFEGEDSLAFPSSVAVVADSYCGGRASMVF